jgi:hypothetical protein
MIERADHTARGLNRDADVILYVLSCHGQGDVNRLTIHALLCKWLFGISASSSCRRPSHSSDPNTEDIIE